MISTTNKIKNYGFIFAVCAAFLYALSALVGKKITDEFSSPMVASAFSILFGLLATGSVFFGTVNREARSLAGRSWILISLSGCASALGVSGWYLALNITPVVVVALMGPSSDIKHPGRPRHGTQCSTKHWICADRAETWIVEFLSSIAFITLFLRHVGIRVQHE